MSGSKSSAPAVGRPETPAGRDEPLGLTVHSLPAVDADDLRRRTLGGRLRMLLVLLACAAPVVASYFTYYVIRPEGRTNYGTLVQPMRPVPVALPLKTLDGAAVEPASLRGQWLLVAVGSGACDAACEQRLYLQRQLREMLGRESDRVDKVWLVTDDASPRPELQAALASGDPVRVLRVPAAELARWLEPAPGQAPHDHLDIVDPMGMWMMRMPPAPEPARVKRDLERLLRASASWDQAGR
jgi:hypothetical protein